MALHGRHTQAATSVLQASAHTVYMLSLCSMLRLISLGIIVFSDVIMFAHRNIKCLKAHQLVQPVQIKVGLVIL